MISRSSGKIAGLNTIYIDLHAVATEAAYNRASGRGTHAADGNADFVFHRLGKRETVFLLKFIPRKHASGFVQCFKVSFRTFGDHINGIQKNFLGDHFHVQNRQFPT